MPVTSAQFDAVCDRIDQAADLEAFLPEPGRRERLRAAAALARRWPDTHARPALDGVPVAVKDVFRVDGLPTRAGSALPAEELAGPEAAAVTRLRDAGAVVAGKAVTAEFAYFAPGPTRNPRHREHTPGGSSSGSAAAVAAGIVPLALGTQTAGSIVRPAAYCGCVGLKPTYGRVPCAGVIANAPTFDTVGLLAADLAVARAAAAVLVEDWTEPASDRAPVLGLPARPYLDQVAPVALEAFERQVAALRAAGYDVRETSLLSDVAEVNRRHTVVNLVELARTHEAWFDRYAERYRTETATAIREGRAIAPDTYVAALDAVRAFRQETPARMEEAGIDVVICPAATGPAPRGLGATGSPLMNVPWTQAGAPALSLPAGAVAAEPAAPVLPVGLQCVGRPGGDERLLADAAGIAAALD